MNAKITRIWQKIIKFASMKHNNSEIANDSGKIIGLILLSILWIWLVYYTFTRGGINLKNILTTVLSGIIIFVPLWKKYIQPILAGRKEK